MAAMAVLASRTNAETTTTPPPPIKVVISAPVPATTFAPPVPATTFPPTTFATCPPQATCPTCPTPPPTTYPPPPTTTTPAPTTTTTTTLAPTTTTTTTPAPTTTSRPVVNGRYVRIVQTKVICLNIAEIQVISNGVNIAQGKPVTASSEMYPASHVVNGNLRDFAHTSCTDIPWLKIDLGSVQRIDSIVVYNRFDCCHDRILGAYMEISDGAGLAIWKSDPFTDANGFKIYTMNPPLTSMKVDTPTPAPTTPAPTTTTTPPPSPAYLNWLKQNGSGGTSIAANDKFVFTTAGGNMHYKLADGSGNWTQMAGSGLVTIDASPTTVIGNLANGTAYKCLNLPSCSDWSPLKGNLRNVSTNGKYIFGTNAADEIYKCDMPCTGDMTKVGGLLSMASVGSDAVWGVNKEQHVYKCDFPCNGEWKRIPGAAKSVSAKDPDNVWAVTSDNSVYSCKQPCNDGNWTKRSGPLVSQIAPVKNRAWGIDTGGGFHMATPTL